METDDLVLFVRVAELGSLTAAGRDLRLTPAVVSSRLMRLEKKLGMRLLNRTTRQVDLTPDGHNFLQHSLKILEAVDEAQSAAALNRDSPAGSLKVSAPVGFARLHLANMVNWGLLPLIFVNGEDYNKIDPGDRLSFDTTELNEGKQYSVKNETKNVEFSVVSPLCQADLDSVKAGGVINQVKNRSRIKNV